MFSSHYLDIYCLSYATGEKYKLPTPKFIRILIPILSQIRILYAWGSLQISFLLIMIPRIDEQLKQ